MMFQQSYIGIQTKLVKHLLTYGPSISSSLLPNSSSDPLHRSISSISIGGSRSRGDNNHLHDLESVSSVSEDLSQGDLDDADGHSEPSYQNMIAAIQSPPASNPPAPPPPLPPASTAAVLTEKDSSRSTPAATAQVSPQNNNNNIHHHTPSNNKVDLASQKAPPPSITRASSTNTSPPQVSSSRSSLITSRFRTPSPGRLEEEKKSPKQLSTEDLLLR